jgi:TonB-dependent SusC/RagA subfamily outer membrane receptor
MIFVMGTTVVALLALSVGAVPAQGIASLVSNADRLAATYAEAPAEAARAGRMLALPARLDVQGVNLVAGLMRLQQQSGAVLAFSPSLLPRNHLVSCDCTELSVGEALDMLLLGTAFRYVELGSQVVVEPRPQSLASRVMLASNTTDARLFGAPRAEPVSLALLRNPRLAEQAGTITGQVVDARTQRPLAGTQVTVARSGIGAVANASGRFELRNVPVGSVTVWAQMIGYGAEEQVVSVVSGEPVTVNFQLTEQALALDAIVVTGTAGQARRREVGNSMAQVNLAKVAEPVANVDQLLQARAPGLLVTESSGMAGSGAQIRLRGGVSVSQSNQPLIYVDGVRVYSEPYKKNYAPGGGTGTGSGNVTASPLSDIPPGDIERIEVIKGSAATTLYGTEAAAGVIQIFTKRGSTGKARWTGQVTQGFNRLMPFAPEPRPFLNLDEFTRRNQSLNFLPGTGVALRQGYSLSATGGAEALQYFVSANLDRSEGVLPLDVERKIGLRGNFAFTPVEHLRLNWNTSFTNNAITNTPAGNAAHGITLNAFRQDRNYFGSANPDTIKQLLSHEIDTSIHRFITGLTANYTPIEAFTHRLVVGYDAAAQENRNYRPYGFRAAPGGSVSDQWFTSRVLTLDYVGSYRLQARENLASTFSFGGQSITTNEINTLASGQDLPGPGRPTVGNAAIRTGDESRLRVVNAGFFGQALFDYNDRYFLTLGMRVDGNSAFGSALGLQAYPKVSLAYVISDESFWPESLGQIKLRAAFGESGRAPGAFDAVRTWDTPGFGNSAAFLPRNLGNPNLGPERTAELEAGFDGSFLDDRVSAEFTYYQRKTTDALFAVRRAPSYGDVTSQLENAGTITNRGIELALNGTMIERKQWGWELGGNVYTNRSRVVDLGGADEFSVGGGWMRVGSPVMGIRGHMILNPREKADPVIVRDTVFGPQQPTLVLGMNSTVRFPGRVTLNVRGEYQGGAFISDGASSNALQRAVEWPTCTNAYKLIASGDLAGLNAWERKLCVQKNYENGFLVYPKDFFKLRDVTLSIPVERFIPRGDNATFTLSVRNAYRWRNRDFPIFDPEMVGNDGFGSQNTSITEHVPPTASVVASLRVTF